MFKVISGGQTGVDQAALKAAKELGIPTGGYMPRGFLTLEGNKPEFEKLYGMVQMATSDYPSRTMANVAFSTLTIRIAKDLDSRGELCTLKCLKLCKKPYIDVLEGFLGSKCDEDGIVLTEVVDFIMFHLPIGQQLVINVAGNSEKTCPGIQESAYKWLKKLFQELLNQPRGLADIPIEHTMHSTSYRPKK